METRLRPQIIVKEARIRLLAIRALEHPNGAARVDDEDTTLVLICISLIDLPCDLPYPCSESVGQWQRAIRGGEPLFEICDRAMNCNYVHQTIERLVIDRSVQAIT